MTLSFGVDPKQKTLMFTTESPFHLNDCQDIDANLPLEKQEYVPLLMSKVSLGRIMGFTVSIEIASSLKLNLYSLGQDIC